MKPTIQIKTHKNINLSKSFLGGLPKLPSNFEWPCWDSTPYHRDRIKYTEKNYSEFKTEYWKRELEESQKQLLDPLRPLIFLGQITSFD